MINKQFKFEDKFLQFLKKLKPKIWIFQGQFDLEEQGHQFLYSPETFMLSIHGSSLKVKFKPIQKLSRLPEITQATVRGRHNK